MVVDMDVVLSPSTFFVAVKNNGGQCCSEIIEVTCIRNGTEGTRWKYWRNGTFPWR